MRQGADTPNGSSFILPWAEFANEDIFSYVDSIHQFSLMLQFPQFKSWTDVRAMRRIQDRLYEEAYELLFASQLYRYEELKRTEDAGSIGIEYHDADHEFSLDTSLTNEVTLTRGGSSFQRFYTWYSTVMGHLATVFSAVKSELESEAKQDEDGPRTITPSRGAYRFAFVLHDFTEGPRKKTVRNSHLVSRALTHVPGPDGRLVTLSEEQLATLGRIDISFSRWQEPPTGPVREIYTIQAPGNRDYGVLWADFTYVAETPAETHGKEARNQPDFDAFIDRFDLPLNDFLRDRALVGFLSALTKGLQFKTTPGQLP